MIATMSPASALPLDFQAIALGLPVPVSPHAISVSLPTWRDNVGYEEGDKRVVDAMVSGYPRFFIHLSVKKVRSDLLCKFVFSPVSQPTISWHALASVNWASPERNA